MKILNFKFQIYRILLLLITLYTLYAIPYTRQAYAGGLDLAISPPLIQITTDSPAVIKTPFTIENLSNDPIKMHIYLQPFKASVAQNGSIEFLKKGEAFGDDPDIFDKIRILDKDKEIDSLEIAPKQDKTLVLQVNLPAHQPASDYYFAIIFLRPPDQQIEKSSSSQSTGGIGINVLLTVSGKITAKGSIEEFSSPLVMERGPVPFTVKVKNTGSHVMAPTGSILITNMFGQTVGKVDLQPVNILAHSIRAIPDKGQNEDVENNQQQQTALVANPHAVWPESFLLGPYSATIRVKLSDDGPILKQTTYFLGLPIQAVLAVIIGVLVILLIRERVKKRLAKK